MGVSGGNAMGAAICLRRIEPKPHPDVEKSSVFHQLAQRLRQGL
jgi:hypothetical protein